MQTRLPRCCSDMIVPDRVRPRSAVSTVLSTVPRGGYLPPLHDATYDATNGATLRQATYS